MRIHVRDRKKYLHQAALTIAVFAVAKLCTLFRHTSKGEGWRRRISRDGVGEWGGMTVDCRGGG